MIISSTAVLAGGFASLLFLIIGGPLAQCLGTLKVLLGGALTQTVIAAALGAICAPLAEAHFPEVNSFVHTVEHFINAEILSRL